VTTTAWVRTYVSGLTYATQSYVTTAITNLVDSSPATLDTLNELAAALGNDPSFATTISTALGNRLRVDINTQGLNATLQGYGRTNLGLGTAATSNTGDFVAYRTFGTAANNNTGDFAAASHTHSIANVTGLQTALDGKQASGSYAASLHSHIISDVTGLQTALDGKQASLGYTPYNSTNPSGYISQTTADGRYLIGTTNPGSVGNFTLSIGNNGSYSYVQSHSGQPLELNPVGNIVRIAGQTVIHSGNIGSQSVTYATNSTRLYASDAPYTYGGAAPYYMSMTYDGSRWLLQVTPGTPAAVRVAYADNSGTTSQTNFSDLSITGAAHKYLTINPGNGYEAMVRYIGGSGSGWYVGKRTATEGGIGTGDFHFYAEASGRTVVGINSSGYVYAHGYHGNQNVGGTGAASHHPSGIYSTGTNWLYGTMYLNNNTIWDAANIYNNGWYRNVGQNGLYSQTYDNHFASYDTNYWRIASGAGLEFWSKGINAIKGYVYFDGSTFGLLNSSGQWAVRTYGSSETQIMWNGSWRGIAQSNGFRVNGNLYTDVDYGYGLVGVYTSTRYQGIFAMGDAYKLATDGSSTGSLYGLAWSHPNAGGVASNLNTHGLLVMEGGGFLAAISGSIRCRDDMRAPIFYDSNDTSYYADFNSTSNLAMRIRGGALFGPNTTWSRYLQVGGNGNQNTDYASVVTTDGNLHLDSRAGNAMYLNYYANGIIYLNGTSYYISSNGANYNGTSANSGSLGGHASSSYVGTFGNSYYQVNTWLQFNGTHGIYWPSYYGAHIYPNNATTYTQFRFDGVKNGYSGVYLADSGVNGMMYDISGNGGVYRESNGRWYWYHHIGNNCTGISTSTTSSSYRAYIGGSLYAEGDVVAYSDARKKTDIVTIDNALEKVINLRGVYYTRIDDAARGRQTGVIAQEINEVLPEVVTYAADVDEYGVSYGNIVGVLIEAIKEQQLQIEKLQNKLDNVLSSR
jgi:hypothetical protein